MFTTHVFNTNWKELTQKWKMIHQHLQKIQIWKICIKKGSCILHIRHILPFLFQIISNIIKTIMILFIFNYFSIVQNIWTVEMNRLLHWWPGPLRGGKEQMPRSPWICRETGQISKMSFQQYYLLLWHEGHEDMKYQTWRVAAKK